MRVTLKGQIRLIQLLCLVHVTQAALRSSLSQMYEETDERNGTKGKRHGPIVQGYSNLVELDFKENTYYIGNLYAGSDHILTKVIFDTRTKWTGIILDNAENAPNPSDYQLEASGSQVPYLPNN